MYTWAHTKMSSEVITLPCISGTVAARVGTSCKGKPNARWYVSHVPDACILYGFLRNGPNARL